MATYIIAHRADGATGYEVKVIGNTGGRHTVLGFDIEADAAAWVLQDKRLNEAADPWQPVSSHRIR